ncbi:hypothetical protein QAD02_004155 [Eretmocerus hayati]|uniref:Uncharacterized protein n=1 Tax=Eretmocerus hayati TaxID=131215 RepID=A0ACC2NNQ7_9HYME|nr:hypothetical protein QAD02_004155 [Eretmocerus hayati]
MWSAISRLFKYRSLDSSLSPEHLARNLSGDVPVTDAIVDVFNTMDYNTYDERRRGYGFSGDQHSASGDSEHSSDSYDSRQVSSSIAPELHLVSFIPFLCTDKVLTNLLQIASDCNCQSSMILCKLCPNN